ncbi:MAG: hypothetical protein V3U55_09455 [Mycobacterium sp.]
MRGRVADELRTVQHTAAQFPQRVALRTADGVRLRHGLAVGTA